MAPAADTIAAALIGAAQALEHCSESPRLDAEMLLGRVLDTSRTALIVRGADTLDPAAACAFAELLERRLHGAPVAYLTGTREFWSLDLAVTPAVLVPRPETELLVELALQRLPPDGSPAVLDLGTGSGAIAIAIGTERPNACLSGVDISPGALAVAQANARHHGLTRIEWLEGSWFAPVAGRRFDLIAANPPYIAADDPALGALTAEPLGALSSGPTGLEALYQLIDDAGRYLHGGGWLLLEHGSTQGAAVRERLGRGNFAAICTHRDFSGRERVTLGSVPGSH